MFCQRNNFLRLWLFEQQQTTADPVPSIMDSCLKTNIAHTMQGPSGRNAINGLCIIMYANREQQAPQLGVRAQLFAKNAHL